MAPNFATLNEKASRERPVSRVGGRAVENERSVSALRAHVSLREGDYISLSYEEDDIAHKSERNGIVSKPGWPACRAVRAFGFQRQDASHRGLPGGMAANGFPSAPGLIALPGPSAAVAAAREGTRGQECSRCGGYFRGRLSGPQLRGGYRTALAPPGR